MRNLGDDERRLTKRVQRGRIYEGKFIEGPPQGSYSGAWDAVMQRKRHMDRTSLGTNSPIFQVYGRPVIELELGVVQYCFPISHPPLYKSK